MDTPTSTELILLKALWVLQKASARELHNATLVETSWSYSSTRKTLDRMVTKGLLKITNQHGMNVYRTTSPKLSTLASLISSFAKNVLNTNNNLSAAAFADSSLLDDDEIEDLQRLLDDISPEAEGSLK